MSKTRKMNSDMAENSVLFSPDANSVNDVRQNHSGSLPFGKRATRHNPC